MSIVVLLARQRSGTGALGSVLDQHPELRYVGEVFHHDAVTREPNYFWFMQRLAAEAPRLALPGAAAERLDRYITYLAGRSGGRRVMVDIKYSSTHHLNGYWHGLGARPVLFRLLEDRGASVLHLTRGNFLKTYVSGLLADANKVWHARSDREIRQRTIRLDPTALIGSLNGTSAEVERMFQHLKGYPRAATFDYADAFDGEGALSDGAERKVRDLLGIGAFESRRPAFIKQVSDDLRSVIENYGEVADALAPTPHAWMLRGA